MTRVFRYACVALMVLFAVSAFAGEASTGAQLTGTVSDPKGAVVTNAKVTLRGVATGYEQSTVTNESGEYRFLLVPPGQYSVTVEAPGFGKLLNHGLTLTVGQVANLPFALKLAATNEEVTVSAEAELIESQRTSISTTVDQARIDNLPINGRNYINFTLTNSQVARDTAPSIGAAPTSGLNIGGQRARSNLVNVDGADAVDNSTNGIRSTASQEAVQEFQLITNGYAAEYGRASGGVVNIITRGGTNDLHGNAFGYLRNRNIQAVNPFTYGTKNPAYTRVQAGFTIGGAIKKNRTFFFLSYEDTQRRETGFSNIGANNFGLVNYDTAQLTSIIAPGLASLGIQNFGVVQVTPQQATFLNQVLSTFAAEPAAFKGAILAGGLTAQTIGYLTLAGGSSGIALNRAFPHPAMYFTASQVAGVPINPACAAAPQNCPVFPESAFPLPPATSMFSLNSVRGNFPVTEGTSIESLRLDHRITSNHNLMLRGTVSPSTVTGIQVSAQGSQNAGLNAFSRTSEQTFRDLNLNAQETWTIGNNKVNEFRFQFARRGLLYNFSHGAGGSAVGVQIPGIAFMGREPFSFVRRTEKRYQFTDNFSLAHGNHNFKFGVDINHLPLNADFTVNYGGLYNFGDLPASLLLGFGSVALPGAAPIAIPAFSAVQTYGLGFPQNFIQGVGNPHDEFTNNTLGTFFQDSWRITPKLTMNYGVRYDVEFTPTFPAATPMSAAAEKALGITEGIPSDYNNIAPRIGLAWDPYGDGKTVVRASYGLFYDHPLLALAFDSDVADGTNTATFGLLFGKPGCGTSLGSAVNAVNTFQGILGACGALPGASQLNYLPAEQRFNPTPNAPSAFTGQKFIGLGLPMTFLPDGFPVAANFQYPYSQQANFSIERDLGHNFAINLAYNFNGGHHLARPLNSNPIMPAAFFANYKAALAAGDAGAAASPTLVGLAGGPLCGSGPAGPWVANPILNFFRKGGLNPSWTPVLNASGVGGQTCLALANTLQSKYGIGLGVPVPFNDMAANYSSGSAVYHGFTTNLRKRFSDHYEFLASYTWSHAIDDSTDLESPLAAQNSLDPNSDRARSLFDQRHRFVFSGVYQSGKMGSGFAGKLLSDWTFAPIVEFSSGRPFNIITGSDTNFDGRNGTDRPDAVAANAGPDPCTGTLPVPSRYSPTGFLRPACFLNPNLGNGNLSRNAGVRPFSIFNDVRLSRRIRLGERFALDGIMDIFNLPNRFNASDVNFIWNNAGSPTAAFDPRQFQFALKLTW